MCWSRFPFLKDGNLMIWSTWSALPFTIERTNHHFTICADQDFPFSKTETRWFEAHDRRCLSPLKELITTLQYVLIKIFLSQRRKLDDSKHMIGVAFHHWKNWSPLYDMCWTRFSFLKDGNLMIWSTWSELPFTSDRTDHRFKICAGQNFPLSKTETRRFGRHDRHCLWPMKELITTLRFVLIEIVLPQKTETQWLEAHDRHCLSPMKELITLYHMCWSRLSFLKRRKLNDLKHKIGIAFHQWKNWSPLHDMCWSRFSFAKDGNSMIRKTWSALPTRWFERHDRHCLSPMKELITALRDVLIKIFLSQRRNLDDLKHMIGIAFHQWKKWSPVYDMCWSRLSLLKDGNSMVWSTWSALPFTNDRTDHHFTICADQDFPSSKDGNLMIWSTWSALPFTNDKTDHHFTICADEDFRFSKTETWFEAHDWHCLSPMKELITTLRYVLIKIFPSQKWKLDDLKHRRCLSPMKELITTIRYVLIKIVLPHQR